MILLISVDNQIQKLDDLVSIIESTINKKVIVVDNPVIDGPDTLFKEFSNVGFNLEKYLLESEYYSADQKFHHAMIVWGSYSLDGVEKIGKFLHDDYTNDFLIFDHNNLDKDHSWVFGHVSALINWLSSLFKIDRSALETSLDRDQYMLNGNEFNIAIWYALRIGLKVYV